MKRDRHCAARQAFMKGPSYLAGSVNRWRAAGNDADAERHTFEQL
jgi:hypothetical protein